MEEVITKQSTRVATMSQHSPSEKNTSLVKTLIWCGIAVLLANVVAMSQLAHAQAVNTAVLINSPALDHRSLSDAGIPSSQYSSIELTDAQLAQMLAPIALYPDTLLTHILIASTYPIELVQAQRWWQKHPEASKNKIEKAMENKGWSPSVAALVPFPKVIERLNEDLDWTQQLGDAFLEDEARVLASIQQLRHQAKKAGSLDDLENLAVSYDDRNIIIQPVKREVVYVPYYDTRVVYGNWYWHRYPPIYWARPHHYYTAYHRPFYWHSGVNISFNFFFGAFHWRNKHVVVINHYNSHYYRKRTAIISSHGSKRWHHKPVHRRGVAYRTASTKQRYYSNRPATLERASHYQNRVKSNGTHKYTGKQVRQHASGRPAPSHKQRINSVKNKLANERYAHDNRQHTSRANVQRQVKGNNSKTLNQSKYDHNSYSRKSTSKTQLDKYSAEPRKVKQRSYDSYSSNNRSSAPQRKSYSNQSRSSKSYSNSSRYSSQKVAKAPSSSKRSHSGSRHGQSRSRDK